YLRPVDAELMIRQTEHRDAAAVRHVVDHVAHRARLAGPLAADVEALLHPQLLLDTAQSRFTHVRRACHADPARELEPVVADAGDDDEPFAVVGRDHRSNDPDRPLALAPDVVGYDSELSLGSE